MVNISDTDAALLLELLQRAVRFYSGRADNNRHINDGRRLAIMARKIKKKLNADGNKQQ